MSDAEALLATIANPAAAAWARAMYERLEPRAARDDAIHAAFTAVGWRGSVSATAKETAARLGTYAVDQWPADQDRGGPPDDCSALRLAMWRSVKLNGGVPLAWRWILGAATQRG